MVDLGSPLSADVGSWASSVPLAFSFQWQGCLSAPFARGCRDIAGATSSSYTPLWIDLRHGEALRVEVTAWSIGGPSTADSAESPAKGVAPQLIASPKMSVDAQTGQVSVSEGLWANRGGEPIVLRYHWWHCDAAGANCADAHQPPPSSLSSESVYSPLASDVGARVGVIVTAIDPSGSTSVTVDPIAVSAAAATATTAPLLRSARVTTGAAPAPAPAARGRRRAAAAEWGAGGEGLLQRGWGVRQQRWLQCGLLGLM